MLVNEKATDFHTNARVFSQFCLRELSTFTIRTINKSIVYLNVAYNRLGTNGQMAQELFCKRNWGGNIRNFQLR